MRLAALSPSAVPCVPQLPLTPGARAVNILAESDGLAGRLSWPSHPSGFVLCVRARNGRSAAAEERRIGQALRAEGLGTLCLNQPIGHWARTVELKAERIVAAAAWLAAQPETAGLARGCLGLGGAGAAALVAAGSSALIDAVVSCGANLDGLDEHLANGRAPTLIMVGEHDPACLRHSHPPRLRLGVGKSLSTVTGLGPRCEEPGTLEDVARRAAAWFVRYLTMEPAWRAGHAMSETDPAPATV